MGLVGARRRVGHIGQARSWGASFARVLFAGSGFLAAALALSILLAACRRVVPVDTVPLDQAGMSYDAIQQLRALDITSPEVADLALARAGGLSEGSCIEAVRIFHGRHQAFHGGEAMAGLAGAGMSEASILELARLDQLAADAGEFQAMRLAGLSDAIVLEVARHRAAGQPVLAGASLALLRNTGLRDATLLELARRGVPDSQASTILAGRRRGATDAEILRAFPGT